jgi:hypothetical protein
MLDGLFQPIHLLVGLPVVLGIFAPFFLVCRWLWRRAK